MQLDHGGPELARIHARNNDKKYFCHFTGFLEGIAASGYVEIGEIEPLVAECINFVENSGDADASDLVQDFEADLLEHNAVADAVTVRLDLMEADCEKSQLNRFLGFCRGIACDALITLEEALAILKIVEDQPSLMSVVGVKQICTIAQDAVADGILSKAESEEICDAIGQVVGDCYADTGMSQTVGVANVQETRLKNVDEDLIEKVIVLTGTFRTTPRRLFESELEALGATISRSVTRKTDYLIIGGEASRDWIEMNRGTKIRKAQELLLKSERPFFVSEAHILRLLGQSG